MKITDEMVEKEAILLHNQSELQQHNIWKRRGHHGSYVIMKWEEMSEGFYKENVRKIVRKRLEEENAPVPGGRTRKVRPVQNVPKKQSKRKRTTR